MTAQQLLQTALQGSAQLQWSTVHRVGNGECFAHVEGGTFGVSGGPCNLDHDGNEVLSFAVVQAEDGQELSPWSHFDTPEEAIAAAEQAEAEEQA